MVTVSPISLLVVGPVHAHVVCHFILIAHIRKEPPHKLKSLQIAFRLLFLVGFVEESAVGYFYLHHHQTLAFSLLGRFFFYLPHHVINVSSGHRLQRNVVRVFNGFPHDIVTVGFLEQMQQSQEISSSVPF